MPLEGTYTIEEITDVDLFEYAYQRDDYIMGVIKNGEVHELVTEEQLKEGVEGWNWYTL